MTDQRLHDLLHEHVADLQPTDLGTAAWRDARRTRQRRAAAVASAAVVAVVVAGVLVIRPGGDGDPVPPAQSPTAGTATPSTALVQPSADYRGATTWWAPPLGNEGDLPLFSGTPLPEEIDLAAGAPAHPAGVRAVAVYEIAPDSPDPGRVIIVGTDGASYSLDVGRLDPVADEEGNPLRPLVAESVAPDGRHVFFIQEDSLEVYDLMAATWATYETVPWLAEGARWISATDIWAPGELGRPDGIGTTYDVAGGSADDSWTAPPSVWDTSDEPHGIVRESEGGGVAQAMFLSEAAIDPQGVPMTALDAVAARIRWDGGVDLLVMPAQGDGRWKGCCPVVGWLDDQTVLLQSRSNTSRILAWRVGTPDLQRVSVLTGWVPGEEVPVGTFADLR